MSNIYLFYYLFYFTLILLMNNKTFLSVNFNSPTELHAYGIYSESRSEGLQEFDSKMEFTNCV